MFFLRFKCLFVFKFSVLIGVLFSLSTSFSFASPFVLRPNLATIEARATAVEECKSCRKPQSNLQRYLSELPAVKNGDFGVYNAAVFDEESWLSITDLRKRRKSSLTDEEKAILAASYKVGYAGGCGADGAAGNATVIRLPDGRDAIVVSAHIFVDFKTKRPKCDLTKVRFFPDVGLNDNEVKVDMSVAGRSVNTDGTMPLNLEESIASIDGPRDERSDFLIFPLAENVSNDRMPDGSRRGYMKIADRTETRGQSYLIGKTPSFKGGRITSYQQCSYYWDPTQLFHSCDTTNGSSSSALVRYEGGEMVMIGVHQGELSYMPSERPLPSDHRDLNLATPVSMMGSHLK